MWSNDVRNNQQGRRPARNQHSNSRQPHSWHNNNSRRRDFITGPTNNQSTNADTADNFNSLTLNPNAAEFVPRNSSQALFRQLEYAGYQNSTITETGDTLRERLDEQLRSETYECMICCDKILRTDPIWSCQQCYHAFHLQCVKKWARSSNLEQNTDANQGWRCPGCQFVTKNDQPLDYFCYCLREALEISVRAARSFTSPHSCGQLCIKRRKKDCVHPCTLLCHAGPCPPCPKIVEKSCDCGTQRKQVRCGSDNFKCDKPCEKTLNCETHTCDLICHSGPCPSCKETLQNTCHCGKTSQTVPCSLETTANLTFSCGEACEKNLDCNNHTCQTKCHAGPCALCPLSPSVVKTCSCGKMTAADLAPIPRTSCLEPLQTCGQVCGKSLPCGSREEPHTCKSLCHESLQCPLCDRKTKVRCRCGAFDDFVSCSVYVEVTPDHPYLCDKRCGKKKTCKVHKCKEACCVDFDHLCMQVCGKKLSCGTHTCEQLCHSGKCRPCSIVSFDELHCYCGASVIFPPVPCGTKPPACDSVCTRDHACSHPVTHCCHSDPTCPPCSHLTQKLCYGGHELRRNIPCYINDVSCGKPCGKSLPCGQHKCTKACHPGECTTTISVATATSAGRSLPMPGEAVVEFKCTQPCVVSRPICGHPCGAPCHIATNETCPDLPCKFKVPVTCKCGRIRSTVKCRELDKKINADKGQEDDKLKCLPCNDDCARHQRNMQFAQALGIQYKKFTESGEEIMPGGGDSTPLYTEFLKSHFKTHHDFLVQLEKLFADLIDAANNCNASGTVTKSHCFPPMKNDQRRLVHEFAAFYNIETLSYDADPVRNVVATATKGKSKVPIILLSTVCRPTEIRPTRVAAPSALNLQKLDPAPAEMECQSISSTMPSKGFVMKL